VNEKLQQIQAAIREKVAEQGKLLGKNAGVTQEDILNVERLNGEVNALQAEAATLAKAANLQAQFEAQQKELARPTTSLPHPSGEGQQLVGVQEAGETVIDTHRKGTDVQSLGAGLLSEKEMRAIRQPEYKSAFLRYLKCGGFAGLTHVEQKTLQEGADVQGGFLVPEDLINAVIMKKPTPTRVMNYVSQFNTTRDALSIPKINYTTDDLYSTGIRVSWTGEVPASSTAHRVTEPIFGQVRIPIYTAMLSMPVTNDLIEDSAVALLPWIESRFAETYELLQDNMILNGTGISQPTGILVNPNGTDQPATVGTGSSGAMTADGILSIAYSLPEQYDEEGRFVFNKTNCGQAIAKLKDSQNRYMWGMGYQDSGIAPPIRGKELLGYPVNFSGFMPNVGAGTFPLIFGDFRGYYLVRRVGFSVQILRELYAETNQILLLGRVRFGGMTAEPWRLKVQVAT
jgi:HK97 family phage major capsid protein